LSAKNPTISGRKVYSARCVFAFSAFGSMGGLMIALLTYWQMTSSTGSTR
jgi:hypothetical protein